MLLFLLSRILTTAHVHLYTSINDTGELRIILTVQNIFTRDFAAVLETENTKSILKFKKATDEEKDCLANLECYSDFRLGVFTVNISQPATESRLKLNFGRKVLCLNIPFGRAFKSAPGLKFIISFYYDEVIHKYIFESKKLIILGKKVLKMSRDRLKTSDLANQNIRDFLYCLDKLEGELLHCLVKVGELKEIFNASAYNMIGCLISENHLCDRQGYMEDMLLDNIFRNFESLEKIFDKSIELLAESNIINYEESKLDNTYSIATRESPYDGTDRFDTIITEFDEAQREFLEMEITELISTEVDSENIKCASLENDSKLDLSISNQFVDELICQSKDNETFFLDSINLNRSLFTQTNKLKKWSSESDILNFNSSTNLEEIQEKINRPKFVECLENMFEKEVDCEIKTNTNSSTGSISSFQPLLEVDQVDKNQSGNDYFKIAETTENPHPTLFPIENDNNLQFPLENANNLKFPENINTAVHSIENINTAVHSIENINTAVQPGNWSTICFNRLDFSAVLKMPVNYIMPFSKNLIFEISNAIKRLRSFKRENVRDANSLKKRKKVKLVTQIKNRKKQETNQKYSAEEYGEEVIQYCQLLLFLTWLVLFYYVFDLLSPQID